MENSILTSVKKGIGPVEDYEAFDDALIMHINSVFMILNQLGVGPEGYRIESKENTWDEFLQGDNRLEGVKSYVIAKVQLMFDRPSNSFLIEELRKQTDEFEWRLNVRVDPGEY